MKAEASNRFSFAYLFDLLMRFRSGVILIILLNLVWSLFQICIPFLTKSLVDTGIQNRDMHIVWVILLSQLLLLVGILMADVYRKWLLKHIGVRLHLQLMLDYLSIIIRKPFNFFNLNEQGRTLEHYNDNLRIEQFLTEKTSDFLDAATKILIFGILLFIFSTEIGFIFAFFNVLLMLWIWYLLSIREKVDEKRFRLRSKVKRELIEIFDGIVDLKAYNQEEKRITGWEKVQKYMSDIRLNSVRIHQICYRGVDGVAHLRDILILFFAAKATIDGNMTLGTLIAIQYILGNLNQPVMKLMMYIGEHQDAQLSMNRLNKAVEFENEDAASAFVYEIDKRAVITTNDLSFQYSPTSLALKNVSIDIPYGQSIAILGESGSGKSTLLKVLIKLLIPASGEVQIGTKSLTHINAKNWLDHCSVVLQESILFQRSLLYNITFEEDISKIDIDRVYLALELCAATEIVKALPKGLFSVIGEDKVNFSKGQAQRLILARAIYKDSDYYFLDEPFSALDRLTYLKVFKNLRTALVDKTLVIVTHKMEVAKKMDNIFFLENGQMIESGTHKKLKKLGKRYSKIFLSDDE